MLAATIGVLGGSDHIAWDAIGAALRETGYGGAVVIESFTPDNQTIARAAAIWRPLAETQDALAEEGFGVFAPDPCLTAP